MLKIKPEYKQKGKGRMSSNAPSYAKKKRFSYLLPVLRFFGSLFFDKKYLRGKYFDQRSSGWRWLLRSIIWQKVFGFNRHIPWPVSPFIYIASPMNIEFDVDDMRNFQTIGTYFQNFSGKIVIGKGTYIAQNVGLITANHDPKDLDRHLESRDVIIGKRCWIGMNSVILPGIVLGDRTVVGAGSIVTKSFPEGSVIIAGNPAKIIRKIDLGEI